MHPGILLAIASAILFGASTPFAKLLLVATVILFGGVPGPLLLMLGLARTAAAAASLLLNLEGLATMGIGWVVFREHCGIPL